jgi:hypothetical protein
MVQVVDMQDYLFMDFNNWRFGRAQEAQSIVTTEEADSFVEGIRASIQQNED